MDKYLIKSSSTDSLAVKRPADEDFDWLKPKKTFRPINARQQREQSSSVNRYSTLSLEDTGALTISQECIANPSRSGKIPPVFIDLSTEWTHSSITSMIGNYTKEFHIKYQGNNKIMALCHSSKAHQSLKEGLTSQGVAYHTYSRKDQNHIRWS